MSRKVLTAVLGATALLAPITAVAGPASAEPKPAKPAYQEYVALGDSWSADVVLLDRDGLPDDTYAPIDCAQSHRNYPKLVAKKLGVKRFRDATCGSATTDDFTKPQTGLPLGGTNPPQFDRLTKRTDLVTVGIGGNDAEVASGAMSCISVLPISIPLPALQLPAGVPLFSELAPWGGCKERFTAGGVDQLAVNINNSEIKVVRALRQIHRRSPRARVLLVNYLDAIPAKGCWPGVPITNTDMAYLHDTFVKLNAMLARAARRGDA
ncbi:MAG: SGNH/GDSL hydrolase family protein, partial [Nocardioidaceae bacterium]|nr:SGNH/GDSL hydrolase family protein [Nocardioidaceae bacterium]